MNDIFVVATLCLFLSSCAGAGSERIAVPAPTQEQHSVRSESTPYVPDQFGRSIGDSLKSYTEEERLSYRDYEISKVKRAAKNLSQKGSTEIEYCILRKNGRVIRTFDSPLDQVARIRFGFASLLREHEQQLVVEQTADKFWRYWVVDLQPEPKIIYDSNDYDLVYELTITDLDRDGYSELLQNVGAFWYFDSLDNLYSPRPPAIFAYDFKQRRYLPAGQVYAPTLLADIDQRISKTKEVIKQNGEGNRVVQVKGAVLDVVLRYVYTGNEREAWSFYDNNYIIEDRDEFKSAILKKLRNDRLYRKQQAGPQKTGS